MNNFIKLLRYHFLKRNGLLINIIGISTIVLLWNVSFAINIFLALIGVMLLVFLFVSFNQIEDIKKGAKLEKVNKDSLNTMLKYPTTYHYELKYLYELARSL